jgi:translation initiation factor IF-1
MTDLKNEKILMARGVVTEALPSTLFRVKIPARNASHSDAGGENNGGDEKEILAYLGGKMRMHRIKVLIGDSVEVVLDSYGGKGRIVKRL